jgi:post-segregation antitoxin (ccd killing protein)
VLSLWVARFFYMAVVLSVSVPEALHSRWKESDLQISPSALFQTALETELDKTNRHLVYWSSRALNAEKKLKMISSLIQADDKDVKKFLLFESER